MRSKGALPSLRLAPIPRTVPPRERPPPWRTAVGILVGAGLLGWSLLSARATDSAGARLTVWIWIAPLVGAILVVGTPIQWARDRQREFLAAGNRWPVYAATFVAGVWFVALLPLGEAAMRGSAEESKERALLVAAAAEEYRDVHRRWPTTVKEIETWSHVRLPRPTFGGDWHLLDRGNDFTIEFYSWNAVRPRGWVYSTRDRTWYPISG